jgi:hypothetical protein
MKVAIGLSGLGQRAQVVEDGAVAMIYVYKYFALRRFKSTVRLDVLLYRLTRTGTYFRTFFSFFHKSRSSNISKLAITT